MLYQDFDDNKLISLSWHEMDTPITSYRKAAGAIGDRWSIGPAIGCKVQTYRRLPILYDHQPFIFQGCTMTATLKMTN